MLGQAQTVQQPGLSLGTTSRAFQSPRATCSTYIKVAAGKGNLAQREFTVKWSKAAPPDAGGANTCTVEMPIHLRREGPVGTHSFGHMMRDNYYHLTAVPRRFGVGAHTFSWVTWPRKKGKNAQARIPIMERVNKLLSPHPSMRWFEVERACRNGDNTLGPGATPTRLALVPPHAPPLRRPIAVAL